MLEIMSELVLQRDAYRAGDEIQRAHTRACCVMQGAEVMALSSDYASLQLFKEQQHSWLISNLHERAGLRMWAFCQGYTGETPSRLKGLAQAAIPTSKLGQICTGFEVKHRKSASIIGIDHSEPGETAPHLVYFS